jgi:hypothetical protein
MRSIILSVASICIASAGALYLNLYFNRVFGAPYDHSLEDYCARIVPYLFVPGGVVMCFFIKSGRIAQPIFGAAAGALLGMLPHILWLFISIFWAVLSGDFASPLKQGFWAICSALIWGAAGGLCTILILKFNEQENAKEIH